MKKMSQRLARELLKKFRGVSVSDTHSMREYYRTLPADQLLSASWKDYRGRDGIKFRYDDPDVRKEVTYEGLIRYHIHARRKNIYMNITVLDGDSLYGRSTGERCEFRFKLIGVPLFLQQELERLVLEEAIEQIRREDDRRIMALIQERKNELMSNYALKAFFREGGKHGKP